MARLLADIPDSEHKYLKMCCAKLGVTIKSFITKAVVEKIDEWEDVWMVEQLKKEGRWNRKYTMELRGDKYFNVYEDGTEEQLISHEDIWKELDMREETQKEMIGTVAKLDPSS